MEALANVSLVVVDVETTGWLHEQGEITEIGAVRLTGGQVTGEFSSLVRPHGPIPAGITTLTGITDDMVSRAPQPAAALRAFLAFASDSVLVAHNAPFDLAFLTATCAACQITWPPAPVLDTAVLARLLLGPDDVPDCRLGTLAGYFAAKTLPCHRALPDAKATADVLTGLLSASAGSWPTRQPTLISRLADPAVRYWRGWGARSRPAQEASYGHRNRLDQGRRGPHPRDRRGDREDPGGQ